MRSSSNPQLSAISPEYALKGIGAVRIKMPVDRNREFKSEVVPTREQIDPRIKEDLAVLHLAGLSTEDVLNLGRV